MAMATTPIEKKRKRDLKAVSEEDIRKDSQQHSREACPYPDFRGTHNATARGSDVSANPIGLGVLMCFFVTHTGDGDCGELTRRAGWRRNLKYAGQASTPMLGAF